MQAGSAPGAALLSSTLAPSARALCDSPYPATLNRTLLSLTNLQLSSRIDAILPTEDVLTLRHLPARCNEIYKADILAKGMRDRQLETNLRIGKYTPELEGV